MAESFRRGFVPGRHLTGAKTARSNLYPTDANLLAPLGVGDAVVLSSGYLQRYTTAAAASHLGVVKALYDSNRRPFTHTLPTRAAYLPISTAGWVDVYDDPDQTFIVECRVSIGPSDRGLIAEVNVTGMNSATGISRMHVEEATASDAAGIWRIIGLAPSELAVTAGGSTNNDIEVVAVIHLYK